MASLVKRQQVAHLRVQVLICKRVGGQLVAEEATDDVLGVGYGIQDHGVPESWLESWSEPRAEMGMHWVSSCSRFGPTADWKRWLLARGRCPNEVIRFDQRV